MGNRRSFNNKTWKQSKRQVRKRTLSGRTAVRLIYRSCIKNKISLRTKPASIGYRLPPTPVYSCIPLKFSSVACAKLLSVYNNEKGKPSQSHGHKATGPRLNRRSSLEPKIAGLLRRREWCNKIAEKSISKYRRNGMNKIFKENPS